MSPLPSKRLFRRNASQALMAVFGSLNAPVIVGIILLLILLDGFSAAIHDFIADNTITLHLGLWSLPVAAVVYLVVFPSLLILAYRYARRTARRVYPQIEEIEAPRRVKILILFLSWKGEVDAGLVDELITTGGDITNRELRDRFRKSWRMPIEAIAYHLERLEEVIVIPSNETTKDLPKFRQLVTALTGGGSSRVTVHDPKALNAKLLACVDYESLKGQNELLNALLDELAARTGLLRHDVMIDITSGKAVSSAAGTVAALGRDWRVEYVSTEDYQIREYNVTVEAADVKG